MRALWTVGIVAVLVAVASSASPVAHATLAPGTCSSMRRFASASVDAVRPMMTTAAPSLASQVADALPIPPPPPVMNAACPDRTFCSAIAAS